MKKQRVKKEFLDEIRKYPNISVVCSKLGISRQTIYRWKGDDKKFRIEIDKALCEGEESENDMVENCFFKKSN